jgi:hypothetical protein
MTNLFIDNIKFVIENAKDDGVPAWLSVVIYLFSRLESKFVNFNKDFMSNSAKSHFFYTINWKLANLLGRIYKVPDCCSVLLGGIYGVYRYCDLSITDSAKYSQRHGLRCPDYCSKCTDFHHDYSKW